jgi:hypothetical protein
MGSYGGLMGSYGGLMGSYGGLKIFWWFNEFFGGLMGFLMV